MATISIGSVCGTTWSSLTALRQPATTVCTMMHHSSSRRRRRRWGQESNQFSCLRLHVRHWSACCRFCWVRSRTAVWRWTTFVGDCMTIRGAFSACPNSETLSSKSTSPFPIEWVVWSEWMRRMGKSIAWCWGGRMSSSMVKWRWIMEQVPSIDWLIDCLIDRSIRCLIDWSIDWLIDWFICSGKDVCRPLENPDHLSVFGADEAPETRTLSSSRSFPLLLPGKAFESPPTGESDSDELLPMGSNMQHAMRGRLSGGSTAKPSSSCRRLSFDVTSAATDMNTIFRRLSKTLSCSLSEPALDGGGESLERGRRPSELPLTTSSIALLPFRHVISVEDFDQVSLHSPLWSYYRLIDWLID